MTILKIDHLTTEVRYTLIGVFVVLVVASVVARILQRAKPENDYRELRLRIRTWWVIAGLFSLAIILSRGASLFFLAFVSFLALKEFLSLVPTRRADHRHHSSESQRLRGTIRSAGRNLSRAGCRQYSDSVSGRFARATRATGNFQDRHRTHRETASGCPDRSRFPAWPWQVPSTWRGHSCAILLRRLRGWTEVPFATMRWWLWNATIRDSRGALFGAGLLTPPPRPTAGLK